MFINPTQSHEGDQGLWSGYRSNEIKKVCRCHSLLPSSVAAHNLTSVYLSATRFSLASAFVKARRNRSNRHYVLISILCDISDTSLPVSTARPRNLQRKNLQVGKTCGTVSWVGSSTCRAGMKSLSRWRIYQKFVQELPTTSWGPLWFLLRCM